jgi:UDP-N-acetylmuramate--alanine ligase
MIAHEALDLSRPRRLHLLGIGGSGMAPFAMLLKAQGHEVSGADAADSGRLDHLREAGIAILTGRRESIVPPGLDAVIHSAAIPADAPALVQARAEGKPVIKYARAVGLFSSNRRTCAVAGTHGKTTTTAMLAHTMRSAGLDPNYIIGGHVPQLAGEGLGRSPWFAVEACEYDRSFLHLTPEVAIVTNLEAEHLDYYRDIIEICAAFRTFAQRVTDVLVLHESLRETIGRAGGVRAKVVTFGTSPDADLRILPGERTTGGRSFYVGKDEYRVGMPGWHNALNAAAVLTVARELGLDHAAVKRGLATFNGVGRRLQVVGKVRNIAVIDDYAHHPTEVVAGLNALRDEYAPRRLWCVFQPHQYSRLRRFLDEFAQALSGADRIVVPDVFAARDTSEDRGAVRATDLVEAVNTRGGDAVHITDFGSIVDFVRTQAKPGDVVVTMGAGNVGDVAGRLAQAL